MKISCVGGASLSQLVTSYMNKEGFPEKYRTWQASHAIHSIIINLKHYFTRSIMELAGNVTRAPVTGRIRLEAAQSRPILGIDALWLVDGKRLSPDTPSTGRALARLLMLANTNPTRCWFKVDHQNVALEGFHSPAKEALLCTITGVRHIFHGFLHLCLQLNNHTAKPPPSESRFIIGCTWYIHSYLVKFSPFFTLLQNPTLCGV